LILRAPPKNSSKKEKKVFLLGSARLRAGGGIQFGRGKAKTIFAGGKGFCFASALFCFWAGCSAAQEGAGGMRGGFGFRI
jgi:hypothetical protein